jgi:hypothetical protein
MKLVMSYACPPDRVRPDIIGAIAVAQALREGGSWCVCGGEI